MSDTGTDTSNAPATATSGTPVDNQHPEQPQGGQAPTFEAITSQEQLDKIIGQRLGRERANLARDYGDLDELKTAAEELKRIKDGEKSELQREKEAREAAEKRAEKAERNALRSEVARTKGVPASSLTGTTKEELEASADELLAWHEAQTQKQTTQTRKKSPSGGDGFKSGATGTGTTSNPKERAAEALRRLRGGS